MIMMKTKTEHGWKEKLNNRHNSNPFTTGKGNNKRFNHWNDYFQLLASQNKQWYRFQCTTIKIIRHLCVSIYLSSWLILRRLKLRLTGQNSDNCWKDQMVPLHIFSFLIIHFTRMYIIMICHCFIITLKSVTYRPNKPQTDNKFTNNELCACIVYTSYMKNRIIKSAGI